MDGDVINFASQVTQGHPASLAEAPKEQPAALTQFEEPALAVRVEEGVREVIAVVLRDLEGLIPDAVIQVL